MKDDLKKFARSNTEKAAAKAARAVVFQKLYEGDPERNHHLRQEAEQLARKAAYHRRQAVIVGGLIARLEVKTSQANSRDKKLKNFPP